VEIDPDNEAWVPAGAVDALGMFRLGLWYLKVLDLCLDVPSRTVGSLGQSLSSISK
jgi:hypothetical protein